MCCFEVKGNNGKLRSKSGGNDESTPFSVPVRLRLRPNGSQIFRATAPGSGSLQYQLYPGESAASCSYTVVITTSCSSTKYTRDQISISFGDAYGNQIYAPRLDDPSSRAFERCSSDTFQIYGPCAYQICYVYLYRSGPDGWKPGSVKIYGYNSRAVTFYYDTFIPSDIWYGFNLCQTASSSNQHSGLSWFIYAMLGFTVSALI
ncbi:hypothetical protein CJ030_MR2G014105 [Morella rubra]|uniref:Embryo-specific protein ATS3B n=1 Tax=Morella rubra TaxID=262757 RepID=A0A6A1WIY0_9ROSI|nr:hypothetical protein CJ030_MR6G019808 [Morella rubra]KAB1222830.1 hypothetical protein CJ030_MR2G014105 [Morella rubra]